MESYKHKVNYYETDKMGITHHSNYIRFMEEARVYFLEQIGWGYDKFEEKGIISPVVSVTCNYKHTSTFTDEIEVSVEDDGIGFDKTLIGKGEEKVSSGFGLSIMQERAQLLQGTFAIDSQPGKGTKVSISIPYSVIEEMPKKSTFDFLR